MTAEPIPAAQYLRMSTDHQQYSLDNQADAIALYAEDRGFCILRTYCDAAKSGLRLKNRPGLRQLLKDVVEGNRAFRAVLVYDVSSGVAFKTQMRQPTTSSCASLQVFRSTIVPKPSLTITAFQRSS